LNRFVSRMTPRQRMLASFAGQPVDCFPVTAPYLMLTQADHWTKYTRQESWTYYAWCLQPPSEHIQEYLRYYRELPFDIAQPQQWTAARGDRGYRRVVPALERNGYDELDTRSGSRRPLVLNLHEKDQDSEWPRSVFSERDIRARIPIQSAQHILDEGRLDYLAAYARAFGKEQFVTGTLVNSFYNSSHYVGLTNRFYLLTDEPELMHQIIERLTLRNIEEIRAMALAGADAVFIDDATATKDMISKPMFCDFSLPYLKRQVDAAHEVGLKVILIYFGGIADRVEEIVSAGADALLMETTMKGFTNDLEKVAVQVNDRMLMFGNLNPRDDVELKPENELADVMLAQIQVGKKYGRFVVSTGSPLTPGTTLERMQRYIELGHELSKF